MEEESATRSRGIEKAIRDAQRDSQTVPESDTRMEEVTKLYENAQIAKEMETTHYVIDDNLLLSI